MSKAVPALFLAFVAAVLAYAFAHRQGPPLPATEVRIDTTMVMSASPAGTARVAVARPWGFLCNRGLSAGCSA